VLGSGGGCGKERNGAPAASNRRAHGEGRGKENGGGGPGFGAVWRGKRRRGPARSEGGSVTWADTAWTQRLRAAPTVAGRACLAGASCEQGRTAACVTRDDTANRWGRATSRLGGSGRGAGGSASEWGSMAWGTDRRARQHSATRLGFKPIPTESKIFQMVQTDSKFFKL
jgi:hypothetical protein